MLADAGSPTLIHDTNRRARALRAHADACLGSMNDTDRRRADRAAGRHGAFVSKLSLTDFRNYASLSLDLEPGMVVLQRRQRRRQDQSAGGSLVPVAGTGPAARQLCRNRARRRAGGFAVHARLDGRGRRHAKSAPARRRRTPAPEAGRRVRINGATHDSADDLLEWLRVLWITPAMDALFTGPAERPPPLPRPAGAGHRSAATASARSTTRRRCAGRNRLLAEDSRDRAWFDAIEAQMAESGMAIAAARAETGAAAVRDDRQAAGHGPFPQADLSALTGRWKR